MIVIDLGLKWLAVSGYDLVSWIINIQERIGMTKLDKDNIPDVRPVLQLSSDKLLRPSSISWYVNDHGVNRNPTPNNQRMELPKWLASKWLRLKTYQSKTFI